MRWYIVAAVAVAVFTRGVVSAEERPTPDRTKLNELLFPKRDQPNWAHAKLSKMSEKERCAAFTEMMRINGEDCKVTRTFFQGAASNGDVFWNVACSDRREYSWQINADKEASGGPVNCIFVGGCFQKFDK